MPRIEIGKFRDAGTGSGPVLGEVEAKLFERIRQRASELFQVRLNGPGSKVNDQWTGEQELVGFPEAGLLEKDGEFEIQFAVPGFEAKDIQIVATPECIILHAVATQKHEKDSADDYACEFGQRQVFRRFTLPKQLDVDQVAARLDHGVLKIKAAIKTNVQAFAASAAAGGPIVSAAVQPQFSSPSVNQVMAIVGQYSPGASVNESTTLDDLGISSLERLMLTMELEQQLGILISDTELEAFRTIGELAEILRSSVQ
jgi:HSP20 family molecular chaperone IbpA/acyl carrier protein